jgi:hypothetical protein
MITVEVSELDLVKLASDQKPVGTSDYQLTVDRPVRTYPTNHVNMERK